LISPAKARSSRQTNPGEANAGQVPAFASLIAIAGRAIPSRTKSGRSIVTVPVFLLVQLVKQP
jgi:hypothetical protein